MYLAGLSLLPDRNLDLGPHNQLTRFGQLLLINSTFNQRLINCLYV
jgi:hypothetical protein